MTSVKAFGILIGPRGEGWLKGIGTRKIGTSEHRKTETPTAEGGGATQAWDKPTPIWDTLG